MSNQNPAEESCIGLRTTVCANGVVNVKRPESERAHSVFVGDDGEVLRCSCKGYHYRGHCSHADAIEARPLVVASARAASAETRQVATDGGWTDDTPDGYERTEKHRGKCTDCGNPGPLDMDGNPVVLHEPDCPNDDEHYAGGTEENTTTDDHGDEVPKKTERADFGGGESTGVVDL